VDVVKNPALVLAAGVKVGELEVYGVKLGDVVERIPPRAGVSRRAGEREKDAVYVGQNVTYYAYAGTIYQIRVYGDIAEAMPPYSATRLQMKLGKADEVTEPEAGVVCLTYFAARVRFTCGAGKSVTAVDLYAP